MTLVPRVPPGPALKGAGAALAPVLVVALATGWLVGALGVVWFVLGVAAALPVATREVTQRVRLATAALVVVAAELGLAARGDPVLVALAVAIVALAQAPVGRRCPGAGAMVPVLVAVAASAGLPDDRWTAAAGLAAGVATIVVTAAVLGLRAPAVPVAAALAWRHAVALAVTAGLVLGISVERGVTHGYWVVLALSLVLRPAADETRTLARDRVVGTVVGLAAGVVAVVLVPLPVLLLLAAGCVVLTTAWGMAGDNLRATTYAAPMLVLLGSSGLAGSGVALALERTLLTVVGVALAVLTALVLDRWDAATVDRPEPGRGGSAGT